MLTELCQELHNWFCDKADIQFGEFTITEGALSLSFLSTGQYFRIVGSVFNDGVHQYGNEVLHDESFNGAIWPMKIPPDFLALSDKITLWNTNNESAALSPYQSESWGGYSYSLKSGSGESGSGGYKSVFAGELNKWRKYQCL